MGCGHYDALKSSVLHYIILRYSLSHVDLALALKLKSLVLTLMSYYGGPDTIDWSYILSDNGRVIHIPINKQARCPWSLVVLKVKIVVLGPGLCPEAQVLVNIRGH